MSKIIRARAPLRLGLSGGGTDVSPYCDNFGGLVLNATIDRYAYATINILDDQIIKFKSSDLGSEIEFHINDDLELNGEFDLFKAVYKRIINEYNSGTRIPLELITFCDAPPGSGLGSSSTIVVTIIKAMLELINKKLDLHTIAKLAYEIERIECGLLGGRQDQYSATFGGFNFMEFYQKETIVNSLKLNTSIICELEASLVLFYTGISRESANIIKSQTIKMNDGKKDSMESFHIIKKEAQNMKEALIKGNFKGVVDSMNNNWASKKKSAKNVANDKINYIYDEAFNAGAISGKISGAGGGGFMMFFVNPENRAELINKLNTFEGQVSNAHFTSNGAQSWRV